MVMSEGFTYSTPQTLDEAVSILARYGPDACCLAGGTDLLIGLRQRRRPAPSVVVDVKRIPEMRQKIRAADGRFVIGADTVMTEIIEHAALSRHFPALTEAARLVGSRQIRNRATLAGNICNASPAADTVPPLLTYGATVLTYGPGGRRQVALTDFLCGPGRTTLLPAEIVTAVELTVPTSPSGSAFLRHTRRRATDLATVSVSVLLDGAGVATVSCGAVGPRPFVAADGSGVLTDPDEDEATTAGVLHRLCEQARPISDVRASADYRSAMVTVLARRAHSIALARRKGQKA